MPRTALATLLSAATVLALPAGALATGPTTPPAPQPQPTPVPAPAPQPGKMSLQVISKTTLHGRPYVLTGDTATVVGRVTPYVPGQVVQIRISTRGHRPARVNAKVASGGSFQTHFRTRRAVTYSLYAKHVATPEQAAFTAKAGVTAVTPGTRIAVVLLKQEMRALGYPAGNGPYLTGKLERSVLAFRKTNGMARTYSVDQSVYAMVFAGRGAFPLRYPKAGKHVEADLSRQVVVLADKGRPVATYPTSSGKPSTPTILGHYHFYTKAAGTNAKGMYMSNYFVGGYAIHGYPEVPTYAASHGCLRVPNADAVEIFNQISIGESIWVYP
jgi:lipoprotein-anchoring transpeptidase ErfK/SrfK